MRAIVTAVVLAGLLATAPTSDASDVTGTVTFDGTVVFSAPIPGITFTDLTVAPRTTAEATGNGEQCDVNSITSDSPDGTGAYPDAATVSVNITIGRGGPNPPDGECILTLQVTGTDGVATSARGSHTVFLDAAEIGGNANITVPTITVRESKAVAGVDADCLRWVKKQLRLRSKCNFLLLKQGPAATCKDASLEEPPGCDPGNHVDAILALGHGANDQQTNPPSAEQVDFEEVGAQATCQRLLGRAAFAFTARRSKLVDRICVDGGIDSADCRADRSRDARRPLDAIDRCTTAQLVDSGSGRTVPVVGVPCDACIVAATLDRKCMKGCFQTAIDELSDGIVGDVAECGNGIQQPGEFCDDGNTSAGDCCSPTCTVTAPSTEGPLASPSCSDGIDNDCDDLIDVADPDCV